MEDLIKAVRCHAERNYESAGWDFVVECWSDEDIQAEIGKARTVAGAIKKVAAVVRVQDEMRAEVRSEVF